MVRGSGRTNGDARPASDSVVGTVDVTSVGTGSRVKA
jgi:hypothetical protein